MVSTPTTRLRVEKQGLGDNLNVWGDTKLNEALSRLEEGIASVTTIAISGASTTLTSSNYVADQARSAALVFTGTLSANSTVTVPGVEKLYLVVNNTTQGAYSLTIKTAAGTGVALRPGPQTVYCNATDVFRGTPTLAELPVPTTDLAMGGYKITGLGTPSATTDAATKAYVDTAASSVNASGAAASATAAATSATNAATSATNAATSANAAATSANAAATSAASIAGGPVASVNGQTGVVVLGNLVTGLNAGYETTINSPTLSENNRTVTATGTSSTYGGRSGAGRSSGKYYFEVKLGTTGSLLAFGLITSAFPMNVLVGQASGGWGLINTATDGFYTGSSTVTTTVGAFTPASGDIFGIAVDFATGGFWAARNGTWFTGDPAAGTSPGLTGVSGTVYPASNMFGTTGASQTLRLARHEFSYAPPSGFTAWAGESDLANSSPVLGGTTRVAGRLVRDVVAASSGTLDLSLGQYFTRTVNGATAFVFSNPPTSGEMQFLLEVTHTTGAITWPASVSWPSGTTPTLTTGKTHIFRFVTRDGGTKWRGMAWVDYTT